MAVSVSPCTRVTVAVEVEEVSERSESDAREVDLARFGSRGGRKTSCPAFVSFALSFSLVLPRDCEAEARELEEARRWSSIREFLPTASAVNPADELLEIE